MSFCINDEELLEKHKTISTTLSVLIFACTYFCEFFRILANFAKLNTRIFQIYTKFSFYKAFVETKNTCQICINFIFYKNKYTKKTSIENIG